MKISILKLFFFMIIKIIFHGKVNNKVLLLIIIMNVLDYINLFIIII